MSGGDQSAGSADWWHYDTGGQALYVNLGADPNTLPGGLEACPGDKRGWFVGGDSVRLQSLRVEGVGMMWDGVGYG